MGEIQVLVHLLEGPANPGAAPICSGQAGYILGESVFSCPAGNSGTAADDCSVINRLQARVMPVISLIRFADQSAVLLFWRAARMPHRRIPLVTAGPYGRAASGALIKIKHSLKS